MYNGEAFLAQCIESVLAQTFTNFELLLVDDGSTDNTLAIAERYASFDARVRVAKNSRNLGLVGNWNRCIELSSAPWVKFVFQDDTLRPNGLSALLNSANLAGVPLAFGRREFLFEEGTSPESASLYESFAHRIAELFPKDGHIDACGFSRLLLANLTWNFVGEPVAVLFKRDVFNEVGTFHPSVAVFCDMEYWARVGTRFGAAYTTETVADFRVHAGSTTARTMSADHFRLFALDHVVVQHDMAFAPAYAALRQVAATEGVDLVERFSATAIWARGQAMRLANDPNAGTRKPLDDLERLQTHLPRLRKVLARAQRRHEFGQLVGKIKRTLTGKVS